jgi:hypothetical protein
MAHMFCTYEEAAHRLEITQTELAMMIEEGALQEFRDGCYSFLKTDDIDALLAEAGGSVAVLAPPDNRPDAPSSRPPFDTDAIWAAAEEIRLPPYAAARTRIRHAQPQPPAPRAQSPRGVVAPNQVPPAAHEPANRTNPAPQAPRVGAPANRTARRPKPQTRELSFKEWIWTGLLDDRPHTIVALSLGVLTVIGGLAGAAYLLTRIL